MSKRFRDKPCAYCLTNPSTATGDHVFAREFFPEAARANLPKGSGLRVVQQRKIAARALPDDGVAVRWPPCGRTQQSPRVCARSAGEECEAAPGTCAWPRHHADRGT